jgi:hypothetical protein
MKIVILLLITICISSCESHIPVDINPKSFFDPKNLPKLSLENVSDFWVKDSLKTYNSYFDFFPGYLADKGLENKIQGINVAVFESKEIALESMKIRIEIVAGIIKIGNIDDSTEIWWYGEDVVFRNQYNTIIEVFYYHSNFNEIKPLLLSVTRDVANNIVNLSD